MTDQGKLDKKLDHRKYNAEVLKNIKKLYCINSVQSNNNHDPPRLNKMFQNRASSNG